MEASYSETEVVALDFIHNAMPDSWLPARSIGNVSDP